MFLYIFCWFWYPFHISLSVFLSEAWRFASGSKGDVWQNWWFKPEPSCLNHSDAILYCRHLDKSFKRGWITIHVCTWMAPEFHEMTIFTVTFPVRGWYRKMVPWMVPSRLLCKELVMPSQSLFLGIHVQENYLDSQCVQEFRAGLWLL